MIKMRTDMEPKHAFSQLLHEGKIKNVLLSVTYVMCCFLSAASTDL